MYLIVGKNRRTAGDPDEAAFLYELKRRTDPGDGKLLQDRSGDRNDRRL